MSLTYTYPGSVRDAIVTALEAAELNLTGAVTRAARDSDYLGAGRNASDLTLVTAALAAIDAAESDKESA